MIGLLVSHATLPTQHVWFIAAFFSIAMNYTYVQEAFGNADYFRTEALVAGALIGLSLAGLVVSPLLIIIAVLGHGVWDICKHFGAGVPFFSYYTLSCCAIDVAYGSTLFAYWALN